MISFCIIGLAACCENIFQKQDTKKSRWGIAAHGGMDTFETTKKIVPWYVVILLIQFMLRKHIFLENKITLIGDTKRSIFCYHLINR